MRFLADSLGPSLDQLAALHQTLNVAASLLDRAAGQIRDAGLSPTKEHIHSVGVALVSFYDIQHAIYKLRPELEPKYEKPSQEEQQANRRLGETLIAAYDLADSDRLPEAITLLSAFAADDPLNIIEVLLPLNWKGYPQTMAPNLALNLAPPRSLDATR